MRPDHSHYATSSVAPSPRPPRARAHRSMALAALLCACGLGLTPSSARTADAVWVQIPPPGNDPPTLLHPAMTIDAASRRAIVYGSAAPPYDLWSMTLDGPVTWERLVPQGALPAKRDGPGAVL